METDECRSMCCGRTLCCHLVFDSFWYENLVSVGELHSGFGGLSMHNLFDYTTLQECMYLCSLLTRSLLLEEFQYTLSGEFWAHSQTIHAVGINFYTLHSPSQFKPITLCLYSMLDIDCLVFSIIYTGPNFQCNSYGIIYSMFHQMSKKQGSSKK